MDNLLSRLLPNGGSIQTRHEVYVVHQIHYGVVVPVNGGLLDTILRFDPVVIQNLQSILNVKIIRNRIF